MPIEIPNPVVEFVLLGPTDDRRQLQDTPFLGDVWIQFGKKADERINLLIAPYRGKNASTVAAQIQRDLPASKNPTDPKERADIAYVQGLIVANLTFDELLQHVLPKTIWWLRKWKDTDQSRIHELSAPLDDLENIVKGLFEAAKTWHTKGTIPVQRALSADWRFLVLAGLILWAGQHTPRTKRPPASTADWIAYILKTAKASDVADLVRQRLGPLLATPPEGTFEEVEASALVFQVWLDRAATPALLRSVPAVKADAAKTLFKVSCKDIAWAVLDSGIDARHPAFLDPRPGATASRVKRTFDFRNFRKIVSLSNLNDEVRRATVDDIATPALMHATFRDDRDQADAALKRLADEAENHGRINWDIVSRFVEINPATLPASPHGTHVAGIIGASQEHAKSSRDAADGMCPDISLYDFRVLGEDLRETEFAIIAALQFIRYLNALDPIMTIHGANLSLSIPHDVRNFACGRTPICDECERLVGSGVVVVAAAGNHGYKTFETRDGVYEGYTAFSITDPGNADCVITVGSTHRFWPHTYGVSFFSSRGPTGDGRPKPDLVAPGERIRAPVKNNEWGDLDGTSMAAPHVSGAAAMLMARYSELIGQPRRIKQILCASATDLGRERTFQGNGMLDVLRAFQSI